VTTSKNGRVQVAPAMQWYPGDYLGSGKVRRMTWAERGVYFELLCRCWINGGWLEGSDEALADALSCPEDEVAALVTPLVRRCFVEQDGHLASPRMLREIESARQFSEKQSAKGKAGGAKSGQARRERAKQREAAASSGFDPASVGRTSASSGVRGDDTPNLRPANGGARAGDLLRVPDEARGVDEPAATPSGALQTGIGKPIEAAASFGFAKSKPPRSRGEAPTPPHPIPSHPNLSNARARATPSGLGGAGAALRAASEFEADAGDDLEPRAPSPEPPTASDPRAPMRAGLAAIADRLGRDLEPATREAAEAYRLGRSRKRWPAWPAEVWVERFAGTGEHDAGADEARFRAALVAAVDVDGTAKWRDLHPVAPGRGGPGTAAARPDAVGSERAQAEAAGALAKRLQNLRSDLRHSLRLDNPRHRWPGLRTWLGLLCDDQRAARNVADEVHPGGVDALCDLAIADYEQAAGDDAPRFAQVIEQLRAYRARSVAS
jgi:uncharacterized protein YdaU (DUF1376 family)